jgi:hypothetical protein
LGNTENSPISTPAKSMFDRIAAEGKYTFVASRFRGRRSRHGAQLMVHLRFANGVH